MIIEFSVKNFKSIKTKATLSMVAGKDSTYDEILYKYNEKISILPTAVVYGANGAGKSNLFNSIAFLRNMVRDATDVEDGDPIEHTPHKELEKEDSEFDIQLLVNDIRYAYSFSNNKERITSEFLYYFPNGKQTKIFERELEEYSFGKSFEKEFKELKNEKSRVNRPFLSTIAAWTKRKEVLDPFNYLRRGLTVHNNLKNGWEDFTIDKLAKEEDYTKVFVHFLNSLNVKVTDIKANVRLIDPADDSEVIPEEIRSLFNSSVFGKGTLRRKIKDVKLYYNDLEIDLNEESRGIKKLFEIGGPIIDILQRGKTLIFDEIETSLHPSIVVEIIKLFRNPNLNINNAQLIFSTHDTNLLDLDLFRRDQIWFVEKNETDQDSDLYSLSNLPNVRKDENIEKGYLKGKYGAIPFLNNGFVELISKIESMSKDK